MSNARDIINGNEPSYGMKMYDWAIKNAAVYTEWGAANSQMVTKELFYTQREICIYMIS